MAIYERQPKRQNGKEAFQTTQDRAAGHEVIVLAIINIDRTRVGDASRRDPTNAALAGGLLALLGGLIMASTQM